MIDWKAKMLALDTSTLFGVSVGIAVGLCTGWFLKGRFRSRVSTAVVNASESVSDVSRFDEFVWAILGDVTMPGICWS